jgi:hypothetical protein
MTLSDRITRDSIDAKFANRFLIDFLLNARHQGHAAVIPGDNPQYAKHNKLVRFLTLASNHQNSGAGNGAFSDLLAL